MTQVARFPEVPFLLPISRRQRRVIGMCRQQKVNDYDACVEIMAADGRDTKTKLLNYEAIFSWSHRLI